MKGDLIRTLLESLKDAAVESVDLFDAFLSAGYGVSRGRIESLKRSIQKERARRKQRGAEKQKYYNLLYYLKCQGFIREDRRGRKKFFSITKKGKEKFIALRKRKSELPRSGYQSEASERFTIVVFDIPEKEKRKREWLRAVLKRLGLKLIQKSVWMGKVKLPKAFIDDLFKLHLIDCIEIFEITKRGSLSRLA